MDVITFQLKRRLHWYWYTGDEHRSKTSRWTMMMDGEMMRWLECNKIQFRREREKVWNDYSKRDLWEVFLHFQDSHQAMLFKLRWL